MSKELKNKSNTSAADSKGKSTERNHVKCYNCGEKGHVATTCLAKVTKSTMFCRGEQQQLPVRKASSVCRSGQTGEKTVDNNALVSEPWAERIWSKEGSTLKGMLSPSEVLMVTCTVF